MLTIHHLTTPTARVTPHAATAATASSDNTNQISSGHVSIPDPRFNSVIIRFDHNVLTNFLLLLRASSMKPVQSSRSWLIFPHVSSYRTEGRRVGAPGRCWRGEHLRRRPQAVLFCS